MNGTLELATLQRPSRVSPLAHAQAERSTIDLLPKVLTQLLENPDSAEPFNFLLAHILELSGAEAGAIFVSTESGRQLILLAYNGPDAPDRWRRIVRQRDLYQLVNSGIGLKIFDDPESAGSTILTQVLAQGACGHGLLLLRLVSRGDATCTAAVEALRSYGDYIAGILYSARCARTKLRNAQSEERAAIARELHDSLAQSLSYLKIQVSLLQAMLKKNSSDKSEVDTVLQELRGTLSTANLQLRELITTFRLTMHGKTFAQALEDSIDEFERRSSIAFDLDNRLPLGELTAAEEMQLLLIIREALCNVVRHSHATYCWVSVWLKDDGAVYVSVEDNGIGIQTIDDAEHHHGLIIMQERARNLGGTLRIEDREGGGTRLHMHCYRETRCTFQQTKDPVCT